MPTPEEILTNEQIEEIDKLIGSGALLLPLRIEGWHKSLSDGGWFVRHATGRILATVEFVPVEIETGRPALDGNAPARAIVALLNAIPALCATVKQLREQLTTMRETLNVSSTDRERNLQSQLKQLRAENARLRNALLPFALLDIHHLRERPDSEPIWAINKSQITNGHIRRAQELIQKAVDEKL